MARKIRKPVNNNNIPTHRDSTAREPPREKTGNELANVNAGVAARVSVHIGTLSNTICGRGGPRNRSHHNLLRRRRRRQRCGAHHTQQNHQPRCASAFSHHITYILDILSHKHTNTHILAPQLFRRLASTAPPPLAPLPRPPAATKSAH